MNTNKTKEGLKEDFATFIKYKNLLRELTRKNIALKYRNSWLGILWSFFQPLLNMVVLSVVFSGIFGRENEYIVCYPVFIFSGRLVFEFFSTSTKQAMTSFRRNATIIKKVYVPKYMYPLSSILSTFVNFAISWLGYICVWIFFRLTGFSGGSGLTLSWTLLLFVVPLAIVLIFSTGVGLILAVLEVYFRDIEYIWDVCSHLLFYMVPIIYPLQKISEGSWTFYVIKINPLYSMIELFRQCVLYGNTMSLKLLAYALVTSLAVLLVGIIIFNWKQDTLIYHL